MPEGYGRVELNTERLTLRPFELDDVDDTFAFASDPVWAKYLPIWPNWPQPFTRRDAEEFVARQVLINWETTPMSVRSSSVSTSNGTPAIIAWLCAAMKSWE